MLHSFSDRRALSPNQVESIGFPARDYKFPEGNGTFEGTLVMKMWTGKNCLVCYFDAVTGEKFKICVWFSYDANKTWRPRRSSVDISRVAIGSTMRVEYDQTRTGNSTRWQDVEILSTPADDNSSDAEKDL